MYTETLEVSGGMHSLIDNSYACNFSKENRSKHMVNVDIYIVIVFATVT